MEGNRVSIGFINVAASPHPPGTYVEALNQIANRPVKLRGRDFAIITQPQRETDDDALLTGSISVWTDIDPSEPSIDKATFRRQDVEAALAKIFKERGFNNRGFWYVFDEKTHTLAVELLNSEGKRLSVNQAGKLFDLLFSSLNTSDGVFETTIIPEEDALSRVLGLDRLDKVKIVLKRPNPGDHHGTDAEDILRELYEQNMKRAEYGFTRQPGTDGIHLNEENNTRAEVASTNGHVESSGVDDDGEAQHLSTEKYPKIVSRVLAAGTVFVSALKAEVKRFRA